MPRIFLRAYVTARDSWKNELRPLFDLKGDLDEQGTLETIERSVEFKGAGVWTLIFAILIASIGLNLNSTAVIIGAMLISPLMGPIVGAGLALGINNFDLLKRALRNLVVATVVGIIASFLYFLISPLAEAQSELLARTQPTIYDVLIALCGGATGIIAGTRKERSLHAISGVAIATALMPPLCTAGYGLANGHTSYFIGAMYLYAINSIFICLSTFVVVRALRFKRFSFVDIKTDRKVSLYMTGFAILVAVPSIYTAYNTVSDAVFRGKANKFLSESFQFSQTKILEKRIERRKEGNLIELTLIGKPLEEAEKDKLQERLNIYGIAETTLALNEASSGTIKEIEARLSQSLKTEFLERFYQNDQNTLKSKDEKIRVLEEELLKYKSAEQLVAEVGSEISTLAAKAEGVSIAQMPSWLKKSGSGESKMVVIVRWKGRPTKSEQDLVERFVRARLKSESCDVIHQRS